MKKIILTSIIGLLAISANALEATVETTCTKERYERSIDMLNRTLSNAHSRVNPIRLKNHIVLNKGLFKDDSMSLIEIAESNQYNKDWFKVIELDRENTMIVNGHEDCVLEITKALGIKTNLVRGSYSSVISNLKVPTAFVNE